MELSGLGIIGAFVAKLFFAPRGFDVVRRTEPAMMSDPQTAVPKSPPVTVDLVSVPSATTRQRAPHIPIRKRKIIRSEAAVDVLIAFMNAYGESGLYSAAEIDQWWQYCAQEEDLEPIKNRFVREALDGRKLKLGLIRLLTPEYAAVRQRTGSERCVLYRIPRCRNVSGSEPALPDASPEIPAADRQSPGNQPATIENTHNDSGFRRAA